MSHGKIKNKFRIDHLIFGVLVGITISSVVPTFFSIEVESIPLLIFNIFYVFLTFPLNGKLMEKLYMLLIGNVICIMANRLFALFASVVGEYLGSSFEAFYIILNPFLNLIWLVSFWSISLTLFRKSEDGNLRRKNVY
jgi:hypothetical protein